MIEAFPVTATPALLTGLALVLAGPAPAWLARAEWPSRVPRAALVLWQAMTLAALLSALGAGLSVATLISFYERPGIVLLALHISAFAFTVLVLARLLWSAHVLGTNLRARRRRHRQLVDLVGRSDGRAPGARILDAPEAFAYCVPGVSSRLVVSSSALDTLSDDEIQAVLEHERAHARARHDLVLEGFTALHNAFPTLVRSRAARDAAAGLVEMLADDAAQRRAGAVPLGRALVRLAHAPVPAGTIGTGHVTPLTRIQRLGEPRTIAHHGLASSVYAAAIAIVVIPTVSVAMPWLVHLSHQLS
ncbi:M56 family peptidase [Actinobacteria bacterium YIM 96077]|uniref:M56 family peptidase n=1 Tax=Phytoactinopolyspora halophila TaxID=1981511 RepID=A0A329QQD7_9ACTN|nr:M56 family metallopeptidase [Phytoactinopolyspora halophila]AYY14499.1 M56 family peptidase [Actinobacteria bacterium YIM 96077]RAW14121.1 M56 family peptidase [Phytoactinopolyspora halophila]